MWLPKGRGKGVGWTGNVGLTDANYLLPLEGILGSVRGMVVEAALEKFLKHGMPVPIAGNARDWKHGENARLFNRQGVLIGVGVADLASKTIKVKRLINH